MGYEDKSTDSTPTNARFGQKERLRWDRFETPSVAVIERVADATGNRATALEPLYQTIDVDALDAVVTSGPADPDTAVEVSLTYEDVEVTVSSDGRITLDLDPQE